MRKSIGPSLVLMSALVLGACTATWEESGISKTQAEALEQAEDAVSTPRAVKTADQIKLFTGATAERDFTVIQDIKVAVNKTTVFNADPTAEQVENRLKESAAELGGDAVVNVVISNVKVRAMSWGGRTGTGTVVRY